MPSFHKRLALFFGFVAVDKFYMSNVIKIAREPKPYDDGPDLAPGWVAETIAIWTQFKDRRGILDLTGRNISELPQEIFRMRKLESLIVNNNKISKLPQELGKLGEAQLLRIIECNNNQLTTADEELSQLTSLEIIKFSSNKLETVPIFMEKLFQLVEIDLSSNFIQEIPESFGNLLFLEKLNLSNNQIVKIPESLMKLERLQNLDLSSNKIEQISPQIGNLLRLKTLFINDNQIQELPIEMGFLLGVEIWNIENNPYLNQKEINQKKIYLRSEILNFLRSQIRENNDLKLSLFTEKDSKLNSYFEVIEGDTKPTLAGATPEKLIVFLTQVNLPGKKHNYKLVIVIIICLCVLFHSL